MNQTTNQAQCPLCGFSNPVTALPYGGYFYAGRQMPLFRCGNCRLAFVKHDLTDQEINAFYNVDSYFDSEYAGGAVLDYEANKKIQLQKADFALRKIVKFVDKGTLLEIGSAGGYFLDYARKRYGFIPKGVELSEKMCEFGRQKLALDMYCGGIGNAPRDWKDFDIVYMGDVLEHVAKPNEFIAEISRRIKKGGFLCMEVPLTYNWTLSGLFVGLANLLRGRVGRQYFLPAQHRQNYLAKPPYHLLMFGSKSMKNLLNRNGFSVVYLKIYEGRPKDKFRYDSKAGLYSLLKLLTHILTTYTPQAFFGDRMLVIGQKK